MSKGKAEAFRFFQERSGAVGRAALAGWDLATAEEWAREVDAEYSWEADEDPDLSWCECADGSIRHEHEVLVCVMRVDGRVVGSVGGIVDADRAYGRVIEAELASEAKAHAEGLADLYARHFAE